MPSLRRLWALQFGAQLCGGFSYPIEIEVLRLIVQDVFLSSESNERDSGDHITEHLIGAWRFLRALRVLDWRGTPEARRQNQHQQNALKK